MASYRAKKFKEVFGFHPSRLYEKRLCHKYLFDYLWYYVRVSREGVVGVLVCYDEKKTLA